MTPSEENRLFDLVAKQKTVALDTRELKEMLRLSHKKATETAHLTRQKSAN